MSSKREEVAGGWRTLHNAELHNLHVIKVIKSRRITLAGHIARMRDLRNAYNILVGKTKGRTTRKTRRG
jgi:hypothetical protein